MKRILSSVLLFLCFITLSSATDKAHKVEDIPMVHLQNKLRYVSNPDGVLSEATVMAIDTTLYALEQKTGIQTLVVAVRKIEGGDCFDFAYQLGERNGVGQKGKDNGLVILLSTSDRCIQFATGYGLEGILPDAVCKQIQIRYMNNFFKENQWDEGMLAGIQALRNHLEGTGEPITPAQQDSHSLLSLFFILLCCFGGVPLILWIAIRQRNKCPRCHKHKLREVSRHTLLKRDGYQTIEITYLCQNCGNIVQKKKKKHNDDDFHHRRGRGWPFIGGGTFFGGGFGGSRGGFGGGSFGGGSFGGGGAGSKF